MNNAAFALDGVYPAMVTPFDDRLELDECRLERLIEHCIAAGVAGLVVAGTTGEYYTLSKQERLALFEATGRLVGGRVPLIAGCNAGSTSEVIELALSARQCGYDALLLSAPHTSLPSQRELAAHFKMVAREASLPIVLYNFPARAGVEMTLEMLERLREIPEIVAIKEASGDFSRFLAMRRLLGDDIAVCCGSDDQAYDYFIWGVRSWIAGTANVLPREHVELLAAVRRGDLEDARALHAVLLPWIQDMEASGYNQKAKLGLRLVGVEVGEVRSPLASLPAQEADQYERLLRATIDDASKTSAHLDYLS
jgi:4-hydroxy-tetrahydrodipicolinate synthase